MRGIILAGLVAFTPDPLLAQTSCQWAGQIWRCRPDVQPVMPKTQQFDIRPLLQQHQQMQTQNRDAVPTPPENKLPEKSAASSLDRQITVDLITTGQCERAVRFALQTRDLVFAKETADFCRDYPTGQPAK